MRAIPCSAASFVAIALVGVLSPGPLGIHGSWAADAPKPKEAQAQPKPGTRPEEEKKKFPDWEKVVEGGKRIEGVFPLYYNEKEQKLFMEIRPDQLDKELILPIAIARGAGLMYLGGDTLNFGDQWLISFHRSAERILVIRRNVRFQAQPGTPQADAVRVSYTDSILKALPIRSERGGSVLIDLADLFLWDLAGIGINPDPSRSSWTMVKAFPKNVEIEASLVFSMPMRGLAFMFMGDGIADPRGAQVVVHYGLSLLPTTSYKPRVADDRVGHFLSVLKDFTKDAPDTPDVRYVTRWNLEKENPEAEKSPPKQPIIFWIERTVPRPYRQYVREGILEWNKAYAKIGFIDAIQVRDQQADDDFDPEDIRYNTFRWITTSAGFAMGPSRTNPKTGEILDADIVFDEGMIRYWRQEYLETAGIPHGLELLLGGQRRGFFELFASEWPAFEAAGPTIDRLLQEHRDARTAPDARLPRLGFYHAPHGSGPSCPMCLMGPGMQRQLGLLAAALAAKGELDPGGKVPEKFVAQAIKEVVMHEVGHTLGLRHNFKASSAVSLMDANNPEFTRQHGNAGSVMDYLPANIAPKGEKQGDFFSPTIGPYDYWAVEYAHKPIQGNEAEELKKIASRSGSPELVFGTDEDLFLNPDPRIHTFDLGDPLEYAKSRIKFVNAALDGLQDRVVEKGEGWQRLRRAFSLLLGELARTSYLASSYIGGDYTSREHRGDPKAQPPIKAIDLAKQREAMALVKDEILSAKAFRFRPEVIRLLAPDFWYDERSFLRSGGDFQYPVIERVLSIQRIVLSQFLDPEVLQRIQEGALLADAGQEVLQLPEVFDAMTDAIWSELPAGDADLKKGLKIAIPTIRRNLEREHVRRLAPLVLGPRRESTAITLELLIFVSERPAPPDAASLARAHLRQIDARITRVLGKSPKNVEIDATTRAHLTEIHDQIGKIFQALLQANAP